MAPGPEQYKTTILILKAVGYYNQFSFRYEIILV